MQIVIRRAATEDAAALSELAARIFFDTFVPYNTPEDMDAFLASSYTEARQRSEIADPSITTLLATCDGALAGYAQVQEGDAPACVTGPAPIQLKRLYVDKSLHGKGVAQRLMDEVENVARQRGARTLWLGVWEQNDRALAFYGKYGFRPVGEEDFHVGVDRQTDLVLERALH